MPRVRAPAALLVAVASLAVAGCGGGGDDGTTSAPTGASKVSTDLPASDLAASSLRASLTASLTSRAYLTGIAISAGVENGFDGNGYRAALTTLRANAIDLSDTLTRSQDASAGRQLRELLIARTTALAGYAQARRARDDAAVRRARTELRDDDQTLGRLIASLPARVSSAEVTSALGRQSDALVRAADAAVSRTADVYPALRQAGADAAPVALLVAGGLAREQPSIYPGQVDDAPTRLRANLTGALTSFAALSALTSDAGVHAGFGDRAYHAAAAQLNATTSALVASIGSSVGGRATARVRGPLLELQRETIAYARAQDANAGASSANALAAMDDSHDAFGTALEDVDDSYDHGQVSGALGAYSDAIAAFARADAAGSPKVFDRLDDASRQMPRVAQLIARGVSLKLDPKQDG